MSFIQFLKEQAEIDATLTEARDPNVSYTNKEIKGKLERVTAILEGKDSAQYTRLAKRYARLKKSNELLKERQDELNKELRSTVEGLFDAQDEIYTRVVDTVSLTVTLAKQAPPSTKVDYESVVTKLTEMVPELEEQIKVLIKEFTTAGAVKAPGVTVKLKEGMLSDFLAEVKKYVKNVVRWATGYDKRLEELRQLVDKTAS